MNKNTCPLCRRSMRLCAIDARHAPNEEVRFIRVGVAVQYRDKCLHTARDFAKRYDELTAQLVAAMRKTKDSHLTPTELYESSAPLRRELEQIKNQSAGLTPKLQEAA